MTVKTSWPWISPLIAAAVLLNPVGLNILDNAFNSGEQLSRSLGQLIVYSTMGCLAVLGLIEFGIRKFLIVRQRRLAERK
ncbi:MAG: hypothetical protein K2X60_13620 [Xanthobacteraceae bacterium]|nr:hypothetical protein [Xanthobacteraceae bacterium]